MHLKNHCSRVVIDPECTFEKLYRHLLRVFAQSAVESFIIAQMRSHEALPQLAVVRHGEMQELVDDDVVAHGFGLAATARR